MNNSNLTDQTNPGTRFIIGVEKLKFDSELLDMIKELRPLGVCVIGEACEDLIREPNGVICELEAELEGLTAYQKLYVFAKPEANQIEQGECQNLIVLDKILPQVDNNLEQVSQKSMLNCIDNPAWLKSNFIVASHAIFAGWDTLYPISFSEHALNIELRAKRGFKGLVVCDDLSDLRISELIQAPYGVGRAIWSGCDLFLHFNPLGKQISGKTQVDALSIAKSIIPSLKAEKVTGEQLVNSGKRISSYFGE